MQRVVAVNCGDLGDVFVAAGTDYGHKVRKRYNRGLFSVSLAGWLVACLNAEELQGACTSIVLWPPSTRRIKQWS
jgi:hypothetical protein